jgi:hypothetical protein
MPDLWQRVDNLLTGMKPGLTEVRLGLFGLEGDRLLILKLKDADAVSQMMPTFHGDLYKKLDVSLVDHVILEKLIAFDKDKEEALSYSDRLAINRLTRSTN